MTRFRRLCGFLASMALAMALPAQVQATPCAMIVNERLPDSCKTAFPPPGMDWRSAGTALTFRFKERT